MHKQNCCRRIFQSFFLSLAIVLSGLTPLPADAQKETILQVTLNPAANEGSIKRGTINTLGAITLFAAQGKTEISRLTLNITGTGNVKHIERLQLYNQNGALVDTAKIQENTALFTDMGPLRLSEGQSAILKIEATIGHNAELGKTYGVEVKSADAIYQPTANYTERSSYGEFPLTLPALPVTDEAVEAFLTAAIAEESATRRYFPIAQEMGIATL